MLHTIIKFHLGPKYFDKNIGKNIDHHYNVIPTLTNDSTATGYHGTPARL